MKNSIVNAGLFMIGSIIGLVLIGFITKARIDIISVIAMGVVMGIMKFLLDFVVKKEKNKRNIEKL